MTLSPSTEKRPTICDEGSEFEADMSVTSGSYSFTCAMTS